MSIEQFKSDILKAQYNFLKYCHKNRKINTCREDCFFYNYELDCHDIRRNLDSIIDSINGI